MLKLVGLIGVVVVSTLTGLFLSANLRERQKRLQSFCLFVEELSDCIRRGIELNTVLAQKGEELGLSFDGLEVVITKDSLKKEDISLLEEFFGALGLSDTATELHRCDVYLELIKRRERSAAERVREKANLYGRVGFFTGLFLAIMIW